MTRPIYHSFQALSVHTIPNPMEDRLATHDLYKAKQNHDILDGSVVDIAPILDTLVGALGFLTTRGNCDEQRGA